CPPKAPAWFTEAYAEMSAKDLGCHYDALLVQWTRVEAACKYAAGAKLTWKGRPTQVTNWIGGARGKRPCITAVTDTVEYARVWQAWWDSLQPEWRVRGADGEWSVLHGYGTTGNEWGALTVWGVNGILSIVASLFFWGRDGGESSVWEAAVMDVTWMLE
ncbi:hypothetical protein C8R43DRAFT_851000, partial [Mycena crocata]